MPTIQNPSQDFKLAARSFPALNSTDQTTLLEMIPDLLDKGPEGENFANAVVEAFIEMEDTNKHQRQSQATKLVRKLITPINTSGPHRDFVFAAVEKMGAKNEFPRILAERFGDLITADFERGSTLYKATVDKNNGYDFMAPEQLWEIGRHKSEIKTLIFDHAETLVKSTRGKKSYFQDQPRNQAILDSTAYRLPEFMRLDSERTASLSKALIDNHPNLLKFVLTPQQKYSGRTTLEKMSFQDANATSHLLDTMIERCTRGQQLDSQSIPAESIKMLERVYPEQAEALKQAVGYGSPVVSRDPEKEAMELQKEQNAKTARKVIAAVLKPFDLGL